MEKHIDAFAISLMLFLAGVVLGLQPSYGQKIIEEARKKEVDPTALLVNFRLILFNNGLIALLSWAGWFTIPFMGVDCNPPSLMVYNIGASFGAVIGNVSPIQTLLTFVSFGIIEALGFIFAVAGSLLFPKYLLLKILGKSVSLMEILKDSATLLFYSFVFIFGGAIFEAFLIYPMTTVFAIIGGAVTTFFLIYFLVQAAFERLLEN